MLRKVVFNDGWSCCHRKYTIEDYAKSLDVIRTMEHFQWFPVDLPHSGGNEGEHPTDVEVWWYRKEFQCHLSDHSSNDKIYLIFESSHCEDKPFEQNSIDMEIWIDEKKIVSPSLDTPQHSIELTELFSSSNKDIHTLLICSKKKSLQFDTFLLISSNGICTIKQNHLINVDENCNDISKYVTSFNDLEKNEKKKEDPSIPRLNIVMLIVGTRGDVQPFIAYGKFLRHFGHRIRLATHEKFRQTVREHDLEFYPLAEDPDEIMSFMVENSGIIPSFSTVLKGKILRRREIFLQIMKSTWFACTANDDETGKSFRPDVIIANPISYGHIHCAEKLQIPLHIVFTMPSTPTMAFPHPLGKVDYSKPGRDRVNLFSYTLVETLMWLGIGDLINKFRRNVLDLPGLHMRQAITMMIDEKVSHTYCWSPSVVPKPADWPYYVDISGYFFLDYDKEKFQPPKDLLTFLGLSSDGQEENGDLSPPVFIGFGSITGHDSDRLLQVILDALEQTKFRALLSGFDVQSDRLPKTIFKIDDIPYDWLFQYVLCVCHHGGAGTTAAGLRAGKPTVILPFFGDQFFWGSIVEKIGAGPSPIPGKDVTVEQLVEALKFTQEAHVKKAAEDIQKSILSEDGCSAAMHSLHANLPIARMRSDLEGTYAACYRLDQFNLQVSHPVAQVLLSAGVVNQSHFRYLPTADWHLSNPKKRETKMEDQPRIDYIHLDSTIRETSPSDRKKNYRSYIRRNSYSAVQSLVTNINPVMKPIFSKSQWNENNSLPNDNPSEGAFSILLRNASLSSSYSPEVCEKILNEFEQIKTRNLQTYQSTLH